MIIVYVGGIGSGKSLSAVKSIVDSERFCFTNFSLKNTKNYHRLKFSDILVFDDKKKACGVNWEFWNKARKNHKHFSIFLDEIHNVVSSRRSSSRINIFMSRWVSQIRKVLSDSPSHHLVLITQRFYKLDVDFRDLCHVVISCRAFKTKKGKLIVKQQFYDGDTNYFNGIRSGSCAFVGNKYFKYYRSLEMIKFGEEDYL